MTGRQAAAAGAALVLGGALYCFGYTLFAGEYENPLIGIAWATANLLPWLAAFELAKRGRSVLRLAVILVAATAASLLLEQLFGLIRIDSGAELIFQLMRRLPGAGLVLFLTFLLPTLSERARQRAAADPEAIPLLPRQIDWIKAAGNYLEFHSGGAMAMRRMTMAQAEARLAREGFVRIHRSAMVNAARVVRVRRGKLHDEVELDCGQVLKVGDAYRSALASLERRAAA